VEATPYLRLLRGLSQWTRCDTRNATPLNHCGPKTFSLPHPPPSPIPSPHPRFSGKRLTRSKKRWIYKGPQAAWGLRFGDSSRLRFGDVSPSNCALCFSLGAPYRPKDYARSRVRESESQLPRSVRLVVFKKTYGS